MERGYEIVETYVEAGKSGLTDRRPALQRMIADACAQPKRYDAVFVFNFSRFFRDEYESEGYRRKLEKAGVKLISATQDVGEGPHARLIRSIFTSLDAASSEINAEQVKIVMSANAEAGFHNGSAPPLGYRTYVAERRDKKDKKKLEIDSAGRYRYYACSNRRKKGDLSCGGNNVPMDKVDEAVVSALETRLFQPERLTALLGEMLDASSAADASRRKQVAVLRTEETEVTNSIRALFMMVESGATAPDDPFLKERLATLKLRLTSVAEEIVALERQIGAKSSRITPEKIERFAAAMRAKLRDGGEPQVRRRYVRAFVGEVVMSREQIIIRGPNRALELAAAGEMPADDKVRTFMGDWCTRQDSNL